MSSIEVGPNLVQQSSGFWRLMNPQSHVGGGLFAVVSPQCGHCKSLKQNVDRAQDYTPFNFYYMIGDKSREAFQRTNDMNIRGFPTMYKIHKGGILEEFNGNRDPQTLANTFRR